MRPGTLRFSKHHGAGNDFLVLLDAEGRRPLRSEEVVALCDRHRGIGADGVLRATRSGDEGAAHAVMELYNADGSSAEMSGNGIRCLVQAAVRAGWAGPGTVQVDTPAGRRLVEYRPGPGPGEGFATVDMGQAVVGEPVVVSDVDGLRAARQVGMGNPHLVLLFDGPVDTPVVSVVGPRLERSWPAGANVEFVWPMAGEPPMLAMRVWERGVGETQACGTGTCAAAAAFSAWGLGERHFVVHNPGGALEVELAEGGVLLGGPTVEVGRVELEEDVLAVLVEAEPAGLATALSAASARAQVDELTAGR